jgi:hypothetical protein
MWHKILNEDQLQLGSRVRKVIYEGDFQYTTEGKIVLFKGRYCMIELFRKDGQELEEENKIAIPLSKQYLMNEVFEIWGKP